MFAFVGLFFIARFVLSTLINIIVGIRVHFLSRLWPTNLQKSYGKWAVITGCTDGIGQAYAEELAKRGINLILISRSESKLKSLSEELKLKHNIETEIVVADFLNGREVYTGIEECVRTKEIGLLVNNVGVMQDSPKAFHKITDDTIWGLVNVNMAPVMVLMKMLLPSMLARRKGAIVNIASIAALRPLPFLSSYAASKVFVEHFSEACVEEYANTGITIQTVMPSYVNTKMIEYNNVFTKSELFFPSPQKYACNAINTLGHCTFTSGYWIHGIQMWMTENLLPRSIFMKAAKILHKIISPEKIHLN